MHVRLLLARVLLSAALIATRGAASAAPPLSAEAQLGRALFFDATLSASGQLACASCHDPANAYAASRPASGLLRPSPSLRYLDQVPRFSRHQHGVSGDDAEDVGPGGGLMWDGRADELGAQALLPLLDPHEMANRDVHAIARRLRAGAQAERARALWGGALDDDRRAAELAAAALARFEVEDPSFHPYDSRFDRYLQGRESLNAQELRGLKLFDSAAKGNCAECHPSTPGPGGRPPAFTDYRFVALGVPRNPALPANRDARFYDLGLCGPLRTDLVRESREYCGLFRTPSLRNVARRASFFHNGRFTRLEDVLHFYVERDLSPARWYPRRAGSIERYDDLPPRDRANVDRSDPPFDRRVGEAPALNDAEIADLIAFLKTLSDRS
jgi:cytochrome c peroxidase